MPERFAVVFSSEAETDLIETTRYIDSEDARSECVFGIIERTRQIAKYPTVFRERTLPSGRRYRAITYKSHIFFYRVDEVAEVMYVVRVFHGSQDYAPEL